MNQKMTVAAFDFDGTITYRDTFIAFLWHTTPIFKFFWNCFTLVPHLLLFCIGYYNRQKLKESFILRFFGKKQIKTLKTWGKAFAEGQLLALIRPEALQRIRWHQKQGHQCILVSASLDIYVEPWGKKHFFDTCICSSLEIDEYGQVTGKLEGINCRGIEKVRRLEAILGPLNKYSLYAYGDSAGDRELLACADWAFYREMPLNES